MRGLREMEALARKHADLVKAALFVEEHTPPLRELPEGVRRDWLKAALGDTPHIVRKRRGMDLFLGGRR